MRVRAGAGLLSAVLATAAALVPAGAAGAASAGTVPPVPDVTVVTPQPTLGYDLVSDPFSTNAGDELLVAFFSADGPSGQHQTIDEVIGCGLTWQRAAQANLWPGYAAAYTAWANDPVAGCQVDGELQYPGDGLAAVVSFTGAAPALGDARAVSGQSSAARTDVNIPKDGSLVYQIGHNWDYAEIPVMSGGQSNSVVIPTPATLLGDYLSPYGDTSWFGRLDRPQPAPPPGSILPAAITGNFHEWSTLATVAVAVVPAG